MVKGCSGAAFVYKENIYYLIARVTDTVACNGLVVLLRALPLMI
jgi:hypothetical protein